MDEKIAGAGDTMKLLVAALLVAISTTALAKPGPTEAEQRRACSGDAMRLCFRHVRDRHHMRECMIARRDQLGPACRDVFDASLKAEAAARRSAR